MTEANGRRGGGLGTIGLLGLMLVWLAACAGGEQPARPEPPPKSSPAAASTASPEAIAAVLAAADRMDGTEDKVVSQCPGCGLAMEGSADHDLEVAGYHLHFCSEDCKSRFAEHTDEAILALDVTQE